MTKKFAIFVEGMTEREFVIRLVKELAGKKGVQFEIKRQFGNVLTFVGMHSVPDPEFLVLVVDCGGDGQVKSQIISEYASLQASGYSLIVGLRDVYPKGHGDIAKLTHYSHFGLPSGAVPIDMHLAILEVEAWFIEEVSHFSRIHSSLNDDEIKAGGFDFDAFNASQISHPAQTLDDIYRRAKRRYKKKFAYVKRTIDALNYERLYVDVRSRSPSFDAFVGSLETGLFS